MIPWQCVSISEKKCSIWDRTLEATESCTWKCFWCRPGYQELLAHPLLVLLLNFMSTHELLGFYTLNPVLEHSLYSLCGCFCLSVSLWPSYSRLSQSTHILFLLFSFLGPCVRIPSITEHLLGVTKCQALVQERCCILRKPEVSACGVPFWRHQKVWEHNLFKPCSSWLLCPPGPRGTSGVRHKRSIKKNGKIDESRSRRQVTKNQKKIFFK